MKNTKKILITTESREIFILRSASQSVLRGFCAGCGREVGLLTIDQTVSSTGISAREIFRRSETGSLHVIETTDGHLFVCRDSIL